MRRDASDGPMCQIWPNEFSSSSSSNNNNNNGNNGNNSNRKRKKKKKCNCHPAHSCQGSFAGGRNLHGICMEASVDAPNGELLIGAFFFTVWPEMNPLGSVRSSFAYAHPAAYANEFPSIHSVQFVDLISLDFCFHSTLTETNRQLGIDWQLTRHFEWITITPASSARTSSTEFVELTHRLWDALGSLVYDSLRKSID